VAADVERDRLLLAVRPALQRFVDRQKTSTGTSRRRNWRTMAGRMRLGPHADELLTAP
jgi:hypothetical protein